jgi:uncharacterized damage-inducible protein DinB
VNEAALRSQLVTLLDSKEAHATFDAAVKGFPPAARGVVPEGWPYSAWQLIEHIRIAQADILEFCVARRYSEKKWPDEYWPKAHGPRGAAAWTASIAAYRRDRARLQKLARNSAIDLTAPVPNGTGQTYLREILLIADHTAYHVGQLVALRKQLGVWTA